MSLDFSTGNGIDISLPFFVANPSANTTTDLAFTQGGTGFVVPTGYKFHPLIISGSSNADLTDGTATFKVIDNGTELSNGPTAVLSDTVQRASGVQRPHVEAIGAGRVVGVSVTTTAAYAPTTADLDAILVGVLLPA